MPLSLLQTKFHIPTLQPTLASRPRLFTKLNASRQGKLTLVAAPAGFGKSTLVCDWLRQSGLAAVWLSLDASDNDFPRFWRYVIGALQRAQPAIGQETLTLLQLPQPAPVDELLTPLLNDLAALPQPLILVLDDYHVIETPAIHQAVTFLLERLPPQLHLVITSRANPPLPLARLRGRGELTEVRAVDLRFTTAETVAFFQHFALLTVTPADLALLTERTEGWIVGLQLAALSLEHRQDVTAFVQDFSGSNRFVLDYLMAEVLEQRHATVQTFLITTSLFDRFCAPLCDALLYDVIEQPTQRLLQEIEQANLFVIALDDERYWYRYHHLFGGMLQQRLRQVAPARIAVMHQRASQWFAAQGLLDEAIEHARRAGDLARVTQLMEPEIRSLIMRGFFDTATRWLATLPPALIQERPRLLIAQAWLRFFEIPIGDTEAALQQAESLLAAPPFLADQLSPTPPTAEQAESRLALLAEITALRAVEAGVRGQPTALHLMQEALDLAGATNLFVQGVISYALASIEWGTEPWVTIQQSFERAIATAQTSENVILAAGSRYKFAMVLLERGELAAADMQLAQSEAFARRQPNRWPWPIVDSAHIGRGRLCYERNDLAAALALLQEGLELAQRRRNIYVIIDGYLTLAWVYQAQGDAALAQATLDQAHALVCKTTRPSTPTLVAAHQARLWLAQGQSERALAWAQSQALSLDAAAKSEHPARDLALAAIYIAHGATTIPAALALLARLTAPATAWASRRLQIYALQALAFHHVGQPLAAQQTLKQALTIGETAGYVRLLVDQGPALAPLLAQLPFSPYRDQILASWGSAYSAAPAQHRAAPHNPTQPLVEPLSTRELEVLRLVVADASNQEIADQLVITVGTVKNHMTNILGKLGVTNRRGAIRRAAELGLW